MDAITLLKQDHQTVEKLFKRFEKTGDRAFVERRTLVDQMIEELSRHAAIEEQLFYPVSRETVDDVEDDVLESLEEHHVVKWLLSELETLPAEDERFKAKVTVLIENVRHHVEEEENEYFPKVREALGRKDMTELGDAMVEAKETAPTHPHPRSPDTPPGNLVAGPTAGVVDRVTDAVTGIAQGGVSVAQDLIARFTGGDRPRTSPTGSPAARSTATKVRKQAADAVDHAAETGRKTVGAARSGSRSTKASAKGAATATGRSARSTARTARSGAKRTATTASNAAKRTASTAKDSASN